MATLALTSAVHAYDRFSPPGDRPPTLVFIHGWMLSRHYWHPLCQQLSPTADCLTYDLRGFGQSALGEGRDFTIQSYARDTLDLLDTLNLTEPVWLVGHSLGGSIALTAADLAPKRVAGVICLNAGGGIYLKEEFERFRKAGEYLVRLRPWWLERVPGMGWYFSRDSVATPLQRFWGKQRLRDFVRARAEAARGALMETTTEQEVHYLPQVVARLAMPVYFVAGQQDSIMEPKYVHHLASFHADYQSGHTVVELPNCGHLAMLEHPKAVASIVRSIVTTGSPQCSTVN